MIPAALLALTAATGLAGAAAEAVGQDRGGAPEEPLKIFEGETSVAWVVVPVGVRDEDGWLGRLPRRQFDLFVDGRRVVFPDFEVGAEAPSSLVVLQDLSGSMANGGKLDASRLFVGELLAGARAADEYAVATFAGDRLQVEVPFTREESVVAEAMALWRGYGTTTLHDAVAGIPRIAEAGRHGRRAVVLITDGVDNASGITPAAARAIVRRARLPVYVLGIGREPTAGDDTFGSLLHDLARATGGTYYPVQRPAEAEAAGRRLLEELHHQYVLAFPAAPGPRAERLLRVAVQEPGATVYHRRAYYGGPPL